MRLLELRVKSRLRLAIALGFLLLAVKFMILSSVEEMESVLPVTVVSFQKAQEVTGADITMIYDYCAVMALDGAEPHSIRAPEKACETLHYGQQVSVKKTVYRHKRDGKIFHADYYWHSGS